MKKKIAGCVVFFNPDERVIYNITSYKDSLDILIIIDNSPEQNSLLINEVKKLHGEIIYKWLGDNKGIAKALNIASGIAIERNCEWMLTMDQDSKFREGDLLKMLGSVEKIEAIYDNIAIICPYHNVHEQFISKSGAVFQEIKSTMTSGNLLNLRVYQKVSGFEEKLFIDYVDHDYCLRVRKNNFRIIQNNEISLEHSLGDFKIRTFFGKEIGISNHNYIRRYYIARNGLYAVKKYFSFDPLFCLVIIKSILYDFGRILFFEKNKFLKTKAMVVGIWHSIINRYGKLDQSL